MEKPVVLPHCVFLLYCSHTVLTALLVAKRLVVFAHNKQLSVTPAGHPTVYLEMVSDSTGVSAPSHKTAHTPLLMPVSS